MGQTDSIIQRLTASTAPHPEPQTIARHPPLNVNLHEVVQRASHGGDKLTVGADGGRFEGIRSHALPCPSALARVFALVEKKKKMALDCGTHVWCIHTVIKRFGGAGRKRRVKGGVDMKKLFLIPPSF